MGLRFFADHCVPNYIVKTLQDAGHEVFLLKDYIPADSTDIDVISKAQEFNSILLSLNGDFADIVIFPPSKYKGIIAFQVRNHPEVIPRIIVKLNNYFSANPAIHHYKGKLLLVEVHRIRIRE
ncbi:MAG: DUF5615 family PIN-like protein [Firmicutes bacterium]|nr:DUF5615 family PIN-like protein [Bacillota bacterium]